MNYDANLHTCCWLAYCTDCKLLCVASAKYAAAGIYIGTSASEVPLAAACCCLQMRSKRNFCIDIVLVFILLGIGAYIFTVATKK
jgi:hypothetical protein